jgi:hypothetical protein
MSTDGFVQIDPDNVGKKIDNAVVVRGTDTVYRQRVETYTPNGDTPLTDTELRAAVVPIVIGDKNNALADVSRFGQLITGVRHDDILCRFEYNNSTYDVTSAVTGTGAASNANSLATASTGATAGTCSFVTKRGMTYRPAHEMYMFGSAVFTAGAANTFQRLGIFDANDGFFFGYEGAVFGVSLRKGAADTTIAQTAWNKDKCDGTGTSGFTLDPTKDNQYKITYGWLGIAPITFSVYGGEARGWVICHVIDYTNTQTTPSVNSPNNNIKWEVSRTSGAGAISLSVGCVAGGSTEGTHAHAGHRLFAGRVQKTIAAVVYPGDHIATFHSKSTFQGKTNKIRAEAVWVAFSCDGAKTTEFVFARNCTLDAAAIAGYADVNTANSIFEVTTVGTVTGGVFEMSFPIGRVDHEWADIGAGHVHFELFPGETISVFGLSGAGSEVVASFRWEEFFA